jgi:hypothetical protein
MTDTVAACPACDATDIYQRTGALPDVPREPEAYYCERCGHNFDAPVERARAVEDYGVSGLAGELAAADSVDEVVGDD